MDLIYLDHNATTPIRPEVFDEMLPFLKDLFGNGSSIHFYGRTARNAIDNARSQVADLIGAKSPSEIIFTSGGTESNNHAIRGLAEYQKDRKDDHIITTVIEHHAVLHTCEYLEKLGFEVTYLSVDRFGQISLDQLRDSIRDNTILISAMFVNNEIGTILPIGEICEIGREFEIPVHSDAVQAIGKIDLNVEKMNVDLIAISGHKFYAPKGIGVTYIRRGTRIESFMRGGSHERNRRAGTENVAGIVGIGKAAEIAKREINQNIEHLKKLTDRLRNGLHKNLDDIRENSQIDGIPGTLNVSFENVDGETLLLRLDLEGVCASSGSACASGSIEPSHVLKAIGLPPQISQSTVRFSIGKGNTETEIDLAIEKITKIVSEMRSVKK